MAIYGSNYDYGESPFFKDDSATDMQLKVNSLLIQQFKSQYGIAFTDLEITSPPSTPAPPVLTIQEKVNNLLIHQLRRQYGAG
jgi:hypothetical protein